MTVSLKNEKKESVQISNKLHNTLCMGPCGVIAGLAPSWEGRGDRIVSEDAEPFCLKTKSDCLLFAKVMRRWIRILRTRKEAFEKIKGAPMTFDNQIHGDRALLMEETIEILDRLRKWIKSSERVEADSIC